MHKRMLSLGERLRKRNKFGDTIDRSEIREFRTRDERLKGSTFFGSIKLQAKEPDARSHPSNTLKFL